MKRILSILLILLSVVAIGACSKAEIRQAKVMTQAEIDEYNNKVKPGGDNPDDPDDPDNPDNPDDPDGPGGDTPSWPPVAQRSLYYVSVAGAGAKDGSTAGNALDLETFISLVKTVELVADDPVSQETSDLHAKAVDGVTFHFESGTYLLSDEKHPQGLKLEYSNYPTQVKIVFEGEDDAVLSGGGKSRVLLLGNQVDLSIKGMKVADGYNATEPGAGISVAAGASGNATLRLDRTVFAGNRTTTEQSGGALRCAKGKILATECVFEATNYSRNGASVMTNNAEAEVSFTGCTFKSCSSNTGGAANNSKGRQTFTDCDFTGCYTETGTGAAIHVNGEGSEEYIDNCRFTSCKGLTNSPMATSTNKPSGVISVEWGRVDIKNSVFSDCEAATAALINMRAGAGKNAATGGFLTCSNTVFKNNRASDRGFIQLNGSKSNSQAAVAFFDNCVFTGNTMRTNQWGHILHGSNPSVACFNNCTIYGNERSEGGGNGVLLNNDGFIAFTNSTLIDSGDLAAIRNTDDSNGARHLVANSIMINTSTAADVCVADGDPEGKNNMRCPFYLYSSIVGPVFQVDKLPSKTIADSVLDAKESSLDGGKWDAGKNLFLWNGPASGFNKMASSDFETKVKEALNVNLTAFNAYMGGKTVGEVYYAWLTEIGAVGKDAAGTARGAAWWPGAYQAN